MDLLCVMTQIATFTLLAVGYLILFGGTSRRRGHYSEPAWNFTIKKLYAKYAVRRWRRRQPRALAVSGASEVPRRGCAWDSLALRAAAPDGTLVHLELTQRRDGRAELAVQLALPGGTRYLLSDAEELPLDEVIDDQQWHAGGLKFVVLEPLVRLRVLYSGLLSSPGSDTLTHVRLNLIWTAASQPVRYPEDWSDELAATALATERWRDGSWRSVLESSGGAGGGWEQWGSVQGILRADDAPEVVLHARGVRERWWAPAAVHREHGVSEPGARQDESPEAASPLRLHRAVTLLATAKDGTAVYLRAHSHTDPGAPTQAISGSIRYSNSSVESISSSDLRLPQFSEHRGEIPPCFTINVAGSRPVQVVVQLGAAGASGRIRRTAALQALAIPVQVALDGDPGCGILELSYAYTHEETREKPGEATAATAKAVRLRWVELDAVPAEERARSCLHFARAAAACPQLVGAKGASLALLASLPDEEYSVPPGFCLSTRALERQVAEHPQLRDAVDDIVRVNEHYDEATLKEKCARAVQLFTETPLAEEVRRELSTHLKELRHAVDLQNDLDDIIFAVRSSAIGEDSEELSAAGQNDTVLGCRDFAHVMAGVQRCWASLYSFHSTQYRRLHGQRADTGMGVVVQAVVPARAAGVLFSRHPNTGHPGRILITANYGLGESVVSGQVEPDTVVLERTRGGDVRVLSTELGSKSHRVTLGFVGTETVELSAGERGAACVTADECERLGRLAVRQEALWAAPRDLEWAICKDKIYLVQARPITSLERWTEYELLHEMDTAVMSEEDAFTFANTGEVLPGALTPLTISTVGQELMASSYYMTTTKHIEPYAGGLPFFISHHRCGIDIYNTMLRRVNKKIDVGIRVLEMAVYGHEVADERMHRVAMSRNPPSLLDALFTAKLLTKTLLGTKGTVDSTRRLVEALKVDSLDTEDPLELMKAIDGSMKTLYQCFLNHNMTTSGSVFSQVVAMSILLEGAEQFSLEHLSDIGLMLSSCSDVVSADVPAALADIARSLHAAAAHDQFCALPPADCLRWMCDNCPEVYGKITRFLDDHAHRNIKEFDLSTKTWGIDPTSLLQSIQAAVKARAAQPQEDKQTKVVKSNEEIAASVVSPKKSITRLLLRMILPLCQRTVSHREETKALSILAVHKVRLACLRLAALMQRQWLLPDPELVFFFTLAELRSYLHTRDPALIKKASQRRQRFPAWNALKFAEVNEGHMQPLPTRDPRLAGAGVGARLRGTPVCSGDVIGRACVVTDLAEICQLQRGDVLITHSTDIGWSPYFPLLGGVVTELGGLISHGAVIAREYGLPCMVGAGGATEFCRTGDLVLLAGATGVLERLDTATPTPQPRDTAPSFPAAQ